VQLGYSTPAANIAKARGELPKALPDSKDMALLMIISSRCGGLATLKVYLGAEVSVPTQPLYIPISFSINSIDASCLTVPNYLLLELRYDI
jgi:hypothetical protein